MDVKPGKKVVTKDIAAALGVSVCTVNKALTGKPGVSEKRRREVQEKAREMGYQVDSVAQILRRKPITIGVVTPCDNKKETSNYHAQLLAGMKDEFARLEKYKIHPAFYAVPDADTAADTERFTEWLAQSEAEAICLDPTRTTRHPALAQCILESGLPLFITGDGGRLAANCVARVRTDSSKAGRQAADFFYACHGQDARVLVLVETLESSAGMHRKSKGCRDGMARRGVDSVEVLEHYNDLPFLHKALEERIFCDQPINCLYVATGITQEVCDFLEERHLENKITVVGTDYFKEIRRYFRNGTLHAMFLQNERRIGSRMVRVAYDHLVNSRTFGKEDWQTPPEDILDPIFCMESYFEDE